MIFFFRKKTLNLSIGKYKVANFAFQKDEQNTLHIII